MPLGSTDLRLSTVSRRRARSVPATLVCAALALAACGGDDGGSAGLSAREQDYADAWAARLSDGEGFSVSEADAACLGEAIMAELGVDPFEEAGIEPDEITRTARKTTAPASSWATA